MEGFRIENIKPKIEHKFAHIEASLQLIAQLLLSVS